MTVVLGETRATVLTKAAAKSCAARWPDITPLLTNETFFEQKLTNFFLALSGRRWVSRLAKFGWLQVLLWIDLGARRLFRPTGGMVTELPSIYLIAQNLRKMVASNQIFLVRNGADVLRATSC